MEKQFTASVWLLTLHEAYWLVSRDVSPGLIVTCSIRIIFALVLLIVSEINAHETRKVVNLTFMNAYSGILEYVSCLATLVTFAYHTT
jgi:hypothetical protein